VRALLQALLAEVGGILESENCIAAHIQAAEACGATVHTSTKVAQWHASSSGVSVMGADGSTFHGQKLVLSGGAWMRQLVPELAGYLQVERQVVGWFEVCHSNRQTCELSSLS
jgi:sarcosine oxidase